MAKTDGQRAQTTRGPLKGGNGGHPKEAAIPERQQRYFFKEFPLLMSRDGRCSGMADVPQCRRSRFREC
jgi:hypothetical protein